VITLPQACRDPNLFGPWFRDPETWGAWRAFLAALFALPMTDADLATYRACTGRTKPPSEPVTEAWLICGRRAGKSFTLALVAAFLAAFYEWRPFLSPGERATIMVIAADRRQARVIMRYIRAFFDGVTMLKAMVERETTEGLDLSNAVTLEVHTASFRTVRGYSICAALLDEVAYWRSDESANPDTEIIAALRPAMATIPGSMLLCASSPYARRGALWDAYKRHWGKDGRPLVWQADTRTMNRRINRRLEPA